MQISQDFTIGEMFPSVFGLLHCRNKILSNSSSSNLCLLDPMTNFAFVNTLSQLAWLAGIALYFMNIFLILLKDPFSKMENSLLFDCKNSSTSETIRCKQKNGPPPWQIYPILDIFPCSFWLNKSKVSCFVSDGSTKLVSIS